MPLVSRCRFDAFVFDSDDGRLEHAELHDSTTLRPQVASLLVRLLESPRAVVDREALCLAVWGDKAVVDFESGLAAVVRELRQAFAGLGGSADLLETVPRRGYRLRADVTPASAPVGASQDARTPPPQRSTTRRTAIAVASVATLLFMAGVAWWLQDLPAPAPTTAPTTSPTTTPATTPATTTAATSTSTPGRTADSTSSSRPAEASDPASTDRLALAVLPFERYGREREDGTRLELLLADSLLAALWRANLDDVDLIGRATLRPYQGRDDVAGAVAQDLGAQLLIEGSIERHEGGWRITARLLEMPEGRIVWLDGVESAKETLPTREIAAQLANSLALAWATRPGATALKGRPE